MLRIPHFLDNGLRDGGKFVSPMDRSRSTPQKHFSASGIHFCSRLSNPHGLVRPEGLGKLKKKIISSGLELLTEAVWYLQLLLRRGHTRQEFTLPVEFRVLWKPRWSGLLLTSDIMVDIRISCYNTSCLLLTAPNIQPMSIHLRVPPPSALGWPSTPHQFHCPRMRRAWTSDFPFGARRGRCQPESLTLRPWR
jgi:hypothetical protein